MTCALALFRPEPGWSASAALARAEGIEVVGHPLFDAEPLEWAVPDGTFDALLIGSAAVFWNGGETVRALRDLPVHAVGETTAEAARAAGFTVARTGIGGLQQVLDDEAGEPRRFLRLGGEERVELSPNAGQSLVEIAIYRMRPNPLNAGIAASLGRGEAVAALHSAAAARHFATEIDRFGLSRASIAIVALGPRIAAAAGDGWRSHHIADHPTDAALLAKAIPLCK